MTPNARKCLRIFSQLGLTQAETNEIEFGVNDSIYAKIGLTDSYFESIGHVSSALTSSKEAQFESEIESF